MGKTIANQWTVLTNLGEKMSDDEVDELLKAVDTSSGEINYVGTYMTPTPAILNSNLLTFILSQTSSRPSSQTKLLLPSSFRHTNFYCGNMALARDMSMEGVFTLFYLGTRMNCFMRFGKGKTIPIYVQRNYAACCLPCRSRRASSILCFYPSFPLFS